MNNDAVLIGSIAAVVISVVILAFLGWKVGKLMNEDGSKKK